MIKILKISPDGEFEGFEDNEVTQMPEFKAMLSLNYNKQPGDIDGRKRSRAHKEFLYLFYRRDPRSAYREYEDKDREEESKLTAGLPSDWLPSPEFRAVEQKYLSCVTTRYMKLLNAAEKAVDKVRSFLDTVDLTERTTSGSFVVSPKQIIEVIENLPKVAAGLKQLQEQAAYNQVSTKSRGDKEIGWLAEDHGITN